MASRQNASSKQDASGEAKLPKKGPKGRAVDKAAPAKDAELVLYEFIAMLVRISFQVYLLWLHLLWLYFL